MTLVPAVNLVREKQCGDLSNTFEGLAQGTGNSRVGSRDSPGQVDC